MSSNVLGMYKVGVSALTGEIYIYKASEVDGRVLVKREAQAEVVSAFVGYMMHDAPTGAAQTVQVGENYYRLSCVPITKEEFEAERASKANV